MSVESYQARVRQLGCIICLEFPAPNCGALTLHHVESIRDGLSEYAVVPLGHYHHQGAGGVHGLSRSVFVMRYKMTDVDLLALVARELDRRGI